MLDVVQLDTVQLPGRHAVRVDRTRDSLLTDFGRATLDDRYLLPGESYQDLFARVADAYADVPMDQGLAEIDRAAARVRRG